MRHFQDLYGSTGTRIAAHLAFYPACNIELVEELDVADAPIREFHGAADNWTLAAPCRDYIARRKSAGKDAALTEYPGASHAFDAPDTPPGYVVDGAQTSRNCQRREEGGAIINAETGKTFTYDDACVEFSPTVGYDKGVTEAAQVSVRNFLIGVFQLN